MTSGKSVNYWKFWYSTRKMPCTISIPAIMVSPLTKKRMRDMNSELRYIMVSR